MMPYGSFINALPPAVFLLIHLVAFVIGAYFAYRSFNVDATWFGVGFTLYALAEIAYMTYHLDLTVFLFAHTIAEVFDLVGMIAIFAAAAQTVLATRHASMSR